MTHIDNFSDFPSKNGIFFDIFELSLAMKNMVRSKLICLFNNWIKGNGAKA